MLIPVAVAGSYTYRVPDGLSVAPGDIVEVPLGTREVVGVVWDDPPDTSVGHNRLRPITARLDTPPLNREIRGFVDWVARYTLTAPGMVLRMVLRAPGALLPETPVAGVRLAGPGPEAGQWRMTPARERVLAILEDGLAWSKSGLAAAANVSPGVVQGLLDCGALEPVLMPAAPSALPPDTGFGQPVLTAEQEAAAAILRRQVAEGGASVSLLDGITGSGKTEVYFEAVAAAIDAGRQALILVAGNLAHRGISRKICTPVRIAPCRMAFGSSPENP